MKSGFRLFFLYLFFALISGAIHYGLFYSHPGVNSDPSSSSSEELVSPAMVSVETKQGESEPEPPPQYRQTKGKEESPPVQVIPEKKVLPEPVEPVVESVSEPEPKPEPEDAKREPDLSSRKPIESIRDYQKYLIQEMPPPGGKEPYVPKIHFGSNSHQENLDIMDYFGMEVIAYPPGQDYYIYIDPKTELFRKNTDIEYLENYSNRVIFRSSPWFSKLKKRAAREAGSGERKLVIAQLLRPSTAHYIAWKQAQAAASAGVSLEEVDACEASFVQARIGVWIVRIDSVRLHTGTLVSVQDEEWRRVSGGAR